MPTEQTPQTLAAKIEWLIGHMWPPDVEPPASDADVAAALQRVTNEEISRSTVWKLRTGRQPNPTLRTLKTLAAFFKVPISYFGDGEDAERVGDQLMLLALMRDGGIDAATLRTLADLSTEGRLMISEMIACAARLERRRYVGLPEDRKAQ